MRFRKHLLLLGLLVPVSSASVRAQGLLANIPTPNAASLGKYGEIPVNMASGIPQIGVPLHELELDGLKIPIALSYHASGVPTDEHPSWVGLSWSLSAGGSITRVVHGEWDDFKDPDNTMGRGYYYNGNKLNVPNWTDGSYLYSIATYFGSGSQLNPNWICDGEPDEFYFNFGSISGSFQLDEQGKWRVKSDQNIDLDIQAETNVGDFILRAYNSTSNIDKLIRLYNLFTKFTITDNNGFKYEFGGDEHSIEFSRGPYPGAINEWPNGCQKGVSANTWMLRKITSPTGSVIAFTYKKGPVLFKKYASNSITGEQKLNGSSTCGSPNVVAHGGMVLNPVYLESIETPTQKLTFTRSKSAELIYGNATTADQGTGELNDKLKKWADLINYVSDDMLVMHTHNLNDSLPHYFQQLDAIRIYDRNSNVQKKNIRFSYSNNKQVRLTLLGLSINGGSAASGGQQYSFEYNNVELLPGYRSLESDFWGYYNHSNYYLSGNTGQFPAWRPVDPAYCLYGMLKKITYPTGGTTEFEFEPNTYSKYLKFQPSLLVLSNANNAALPAGGARIKKITSKAGYDTPPVVKEYFYNSNYAGNGTVSSGILGGIPFFYDYIKRHQVAQIGCTMGNDGDWMRINRGDNAIHPLSQVGAVSVNYSEVTEKNADGSFVVYKYSNFDNPLYLDELTTNYYFTSNIFEQNSYQLSSLALERGKLLRKEVWSQGQKVQESVYEYNSDPARKDKAIRAIRFVSLGVYDCNQCLTSYDLRIWPYKIYYYHPYLKKETQTEYLAGGSISQVTEFSYDDYRNLTAIRKSAGNGEAQIDVTRFNSHPDYLSSGNTTDYNCLAFANLFNNYKIKSLPVEKVQIRESAAGVQSVTGGGLFYYNKDLPAVKEVHQLQIAAPLSIGGSGYAPSATYSFGFLANGNYKKQGAVDQLSPDGYTLQVTEKNSTVSYTRDYNNSFICSKTLNATYAQVAYSSFEGSYTGPASTDVNMGNWNFAPAAIVNTDARTGKKSYNLAAGVLERANMSGPGNFTISYWSKSGTATVNGAAPTFTGATVDGWTYYEHVLTSASSIIIGGSGLIDELRCYPSGSQMESYTYDPVYGMSSKTDANGNVYKFLYDSFGRLSAIMDAAGKVEKKYEYGIQTAE